jgi:hypothetical protein
MQGISGEGLLLCGIRKKKDLEGARAGRKKKSEVDYII